MLMAINTATSKEMVCLYQVPALESAFVLFKHGSVKSLSSGAYK